MTFCVLIWDICNIVPVSLVQNNLALNFVIKSNCIKI